MFNSAVDAGEKMDLHATTIHNYCKGNAVTNKYMIKYLSSKDNLIKRKIDPKTIPQTMAQRKNLNKKTIKKTVK